MLRCEKYAGTGVAYDGVSGKVSFAIPIIRKKELM
jgi:hypothetical protein